MTNAILKFLQVAKELGLLELIPPFNFGGNKLQEVATGTADTDAVNKGQMDDAIETVVPLTEDNAILIRIDGTDTDGVIKATDFGLAKAPYACTIKKATIISREAAVSLILDILKGNTFSALATITGTGTKPTLSSAQEASVTSFTGYGSVALAAGQIVQAIATGTPGTAKVAWLMLEIERA